ncbi:MAG TPA: uridine phosphorylase [Proteobacteria bacterium]|nr:uridine phosphorylase [Pseudomonadota bacterium]
MKIKKLYIIGWTDTKAGKVPQVSTEWSGADKCETPPILRGKEYDEPSVFTPENLLREARRQKSLPAENVPEICLLDPDGDIVNNLRAAGKAQLNPDWACYHTEMYIFKSGKIELGIVGCAVGSSFAVLVAEQLFASGCKLLISMTSAGQILPIKTPPYFVLIEKALRDEGTSYHYLPPEDFSAIDEQLRGILSEAFSQSSVSVDRGITWTTDAPFRETAASIEALSSRGILAVEMEAAALYAFSRARGKQVVCFAHITNQMGINRGDFEKGIANGTRDALRIILIAARAWKARRSRSLFI